MADLGVIDPNKYPTLAKYAQPVKKAEREILGRDAQIQSIMAAFSRPELCNVILLAPAGSGKAHPNNTPIAVADERGYTTIGELKPGDKVFDENGKRVEVASVHPQGMKRAYNVMFEDGTSVMCNDEHIWNVRTDESEGFESLTLREIIDAGVREEYIDDDGTRISLPKWAVPMNGALVRDRIELPMDPYVVGILLAKGVLVHPDCSVVDSSDPIMLSFDDVSIAAKVANAIHAKFERVSPTSHDYVFVYEDFEPSDVLNGDEISEDQFWCTSAIPSDIYSDIYYGSIPSIYMLGAIAQREALLQGYIDGLDEWIDFTPDDDCDSTIMCRYECTAYSLQHLLTSLGMRATISRAYDSEPGYFRVKFYHSNDLFIEDVKDMGYECEMTCIYLDSASHLYQVGYEHIVTHNTALVQATMLVDSARAYVDVNMSLMIADSGADMLGANLKVLFDETRQCVQDTGIEIVLFIDEFHKVVNVSDAAVEDLKPLLADSGTRGIRVLAATTLEEFNKYVSSNQALVERLQRINVPEPDEELTVSILKGMAKRYEVDDLFYDDHLFKQIYEYTNRYIPANAQPRKSILVLDAMVGWHRFTGRQMDESLLADVIMESEDVNVSFKVKASEIERVLNERVYDQGYATSSIAKRLQLCVAGLNNQDKPMSTFLFTGSTGVGKALPDDTLIPCIDSATGNACMKRNGDLVVGDKVFNREGKPVNITGVYPQGNKHAYEVVFDMGKSTRSLICNDEHLWTWCKRKGNNHDYKTTTLREMIDDYEQRGEWNISIPMNGAVEYPEQQFDVDPYVVGAFIGDGSLSTKPLKICTDDEFIANKISELIGAEGYVRYCDDKSEYHFYKKLSVDGHRAELIKTSDIFGSMPEIFNKLSHEKRIPEQYMFGSVEQRWALIQGLFDTDGTVQDGNPDRHRHQVNYATTSESLAKDVQQVLLSLGYQSSIVHASGGRKHALYFVYVKISHADKPKLFTLPRKRDIALKAVEYSVNLARNYKFDRVNIVQVNDLGKDVPMTCIMVDDKEHLYQAGDFVVTHNTEVTKQLADILFGDSRRLIRMDMTEYANADTLERFRDILTTRIWEHPYSIVLLDEIEKACSEVTRLLLQVLDDGRLTNRNNREVSFVNCYIVMTTNAGSEIYKTIGQYRGSGNGEDTSAWVKDYDKLIRRSISETTGDNRFPPELLGRIDAIVPFQPLSEATMRHIVQVKLNKLSENIAHFHGKKVYFDNKVIDYVVGDNLDTQSDSGGARIVMSTLEREITTPVAAFINENPMVSRLVVFVDGELMSDNKTMLKSKARIVVQQYNGRK